MEIIISNSSDKPICEQICVQVKSLIMNGTLSAGEALPSMRALAKDLHISVITVQRAYENLAPGRLHRDHIRQGQLCGGPDGPLRTPRCPDGCRP
jgi:DNA-binding transcriptional regulator YhcF (GntR family)